MIGVSNICYVMISQCCCRFPADPVMLLFMYRFDDISQIILRFRVNCKMQTVAMDIILLLIQAVKAILKWTFSW